MGMVYTLRRATDRQLDMLLIQPRLIEHFLFDEPRQSAVAETGLMAKLVDKFRFTPKSSPIDEEREEGDEVTLDKAWHGMQFVLAGSGYATGAPLSFLVEEWPEIGDIDVGYGPAKAIKSREVARFAEALAQFGPAELRAAYKPEAMLQEELYLADFFAENSEEGIEYIECWLQELRAFVEGCIVRNVGVVTYIC